MLTWVNLQEYIMPRKKKLTEEQRYWAHRYEAAWHEVFWQIPEWKQMELIEDPLANGRTHKEHAKMVRLLAEDEKFKPKKDYRKIPTDTKELKKINRLS